MCGGEGVRVFGLWVWSLQKLCKQGLHRSVGTMALPNLAFGTPPRLRSFGSHVRKALLSVCLLASAVSGLPGIETHFGFRKFASVGTIAARRATSSASHNLAQSGSKEETWGLTQHSPY